MGQHWGRNKGWSALRQHWDSKPRHEEFDEEREADDLIRGFVVSVANGFCRDTRVYRELVSKKTVGDIFPLMIKCRGEDE